MKISNSKKELARIISENGGWRDGAEWAAQDKDCRVSYFDESEKPVRAAGKDEWWAKGYIRLARIKAERLLPLWYSALISRAEYDHLYPAPDADGWIEWRGGECPVAYGTLVAVRMRDGSLWKSGTPWTAGRLGWEHGCDDTDIIAYRLHKPEQAKPEFCESVVRSIPDPDEQVWTNPPTIEQLAADYHNKLDYANRKQDEADEANMESDAALSQLEDAIAAIGFAITPLAATEKESELVINDWRDLMDGDVISITSVFGPNSNEGYEHLIGDEAIVVEVGDPSKQELRVRSGAKTKLIDGFKFIRRP